MGSRKSIDVYARIVAIRNFSTQLNNYRLEAGRFEDIVNSGLKSSAHDEVNTESSPPTLAKQGKT